MNCQRLRQRVATATSPARQGIIPIHPNSGARPTSPEVSLTSGEVSAIDVPSANIALAAHVAHFLPALTAQMLQIQLTTPSAPTMVRITSQAVAAESMRDCVYVG